MDSWYRLEWSPSPEISFTMSHQGGTTPLIGSASCCVRSTPTPYVCGRMHAQLHVVATHVSSSELPTERMPGYMDPRIPDYHCGERYCISAAHATTATWQRSGSRRCVRCEADCLIKPTWPYCIAGCQTSLLHGQIEHWKLSITFQMISRWTYLFSGRSFSILRFEPYCAVSSKPLVQTPGGSDRLAFWSLLAARGEMGEQSATGILIACNGVTIWKSGPSITDDPVYLDKIFLCRLEVQL